MPDRTRSWSLAADRLGAAAVAAGRPTGWFDELWSASERDEVDTPWDRDTPMPPVVPVVAALGPGADRRGVVVGAGLGADAEFLADRGWRTTAFDISPAAVRLVRARRPDSSVDYRVADVLDLPADLRGTADLVAEVFTVQAVPPALRDRMTAGVRSLVAPGGTLVAVQARLADDDSPDAGPPWPLSRTQMEAFAADDLRLESLDLLDGPRALWVAVVRRDA